MARRSERFRVVTVCFTGAAVAAGSAAGSTGGLRSGLGGGLGGGLGRPAFLALVRLAAAFLAGGLLGGAGLGRRFWPARLARSRTRTEPAVGLLDLEVVLGPDQVDELARRRSP